MDNKSSAHYQRLYRQRLREQGLVKKEVWILPEHAPLLVAFERKLRQPQSLLASMEKEEGMSMPQVWTAQALHEALAATELFQSGQAGIELIQGADASLHITMREYGDLPLFIAVFGEQIIVEALLWPAADVKDAATFNEEVLRTHKLGEADRIVTLLSRYNGQIRAVAKGVRRTGSKFGARLEKPTRHKAK